MKTVNNVFILLSVLLGVACAVIALRHREATQMWFMVGMDAIVGMGFFLENRKLNKEEKAKRLENKFNKKWD